jgi:NADH dehydrogenase
VWAGALAGLVSGAVTTMLLLPQVVEAPSLLQLGPPAFGITLQILFGTMLGAGYSQLFRYHPRGYAAATAGGLLYGLLWWIIGPLTILPFAWGDVPTWSAEDASAAFPLLVGYLLYGSLLGAGYYVLVRYSVRLPEWPNAAILEEHKPVTRIVILGGGFGGLAATHQLEKLLVRHTDVEIILVSDSNFLLFTPMLAGVAGSSLEAQHIAAPVLSTLSWARFMRTKVDGIELDTKRVRFRTTPTAEPGRLCYDHLVLALGSVPSYSGIQGAKEHAFDFKTLGDAMRLRNHVIIQLERADAEENPAARKQHLTFVSVGGGYSGVEIITELVDLTHNVLRYYPRLSAQELQFVLVHSRDRLLPAISEGLAAYTKRKLEARGVDLVLNTYVERVTPDGVVLDDGRKITSGTVIWTAGSQPHPLLASLSYEKDRRGAVMTDTELRVKGQQDVWALGDCAHIPNVYKGEEPHPPTAQHAEREGKHVARNITASLRGEEPIPFRFKALGTLVPIGRRSAVAEIRGLKFSGLLAWFLWRSIYLSKLPTLEKKARVLFDWIVDLFFERDIVLLRELEPTPKGAHIPAQQAGRD